MISIMPATSTLNGMRRVHAGIVCSGLCGPRAIDARRNPSSWTDGSQNGCQIKRCVFRVDADRASIMCGRSPTGQPPSSLVRSPRAASSCDKRSRVGELPPQPDSQYHRNLHFANRFFETKPTVRNWGTHDPYTAGRAIPTGISSVLGRLRTALGRLRWANGNLKSQACFLPCGVQYTLCPTYRAVQA